MFCMYCGTELIDNAKFCYQCGQKVVIPTVSAAEEKEVVVEGKETVVADDEPTISESTAVIPYYEDVNRKSRYKVFSTVNHKIFDDFYKKHYGNSWVEYASAFAGDNILEYDGMLFYLIPYEYSQECQKRPAFPKSGSRFVFGWIDETQHHKVLLPEAFTPYDIYNTHHQIFTIYNDILYVFGYTEDFKGYSTIALFAFDFEKRTFSSVDVFNTTDFIVHPMFNSRGELIYLKFRNDNKSPILVQRVSGEKITINSILGYNDKYIYYSKEYKSGPKYYQLEKDTFTARELSEITEDLKKKEIVFIDAATDVVWYSDDSENIFNLTGIDLNNFDVYHWKAPDSHYLSKLADEGNIHLVFCGNRYLIYDGTGIYYDQFPDKIIAPGIYAYDSKGQLYASADLKGIDYLRFCYAATDTYSLKQITRDVENKRGAEMAICLKGNKSIEPIRIAKMI